MRLMTWNIHGCVGTDWRRSPDRIADAVEAVQPDIFAVQEVDLRESHGDPVPLLDLLADHAGHHRHEVWTLSDADRQYGIALISRWPIRDAACIDLAYRRREPRCAIDAVVETPKGDLRIVATHLGLSRLERIHQIGRLAEALGEVDRPTAVLGDFNDWRRPGFVGRALKDRFPTVVTARTFPSRLPIFALDRIFLSAHFGAQAKPVPFAAAASDHLPVIADLHWV